jgi:hypothetical protein
MSVSFAICGGLRFTLRSPHFEQNSLSTYNGIGIVTIEGVIDGPPDVRDTYVNLRVNAERPFWSFDDHAAAPCRDADVMRFSG